MLCDDLEGKMGRVRGEREAQEEGDIGIHMPDSLCYTAETSKTL